MTMSLILITVIDIGIGTGGGGGGGGGGLKVGAPSPRFEGGGAVLSFSQPGSGRDTTRPLPQCLDLHWDQYI